MKKESGKQKLIELLNEYENTLKPNEQIEWTENGVKSTPLVIISKKYGFIKWLVENDKIDQKGIEYKFQDVLFELEEEEIVKEKSDFLIMLLSISDTPIEDLISYLK